jgi:hypothetical protein
MWNVIFYTKEWTLAEGVWKQDDEEYAYGSKMGDVTGDCKILHFEEHHDL